MREKIKKHHGKRFNIEFDGDEIILDSMGEIIKFNIVDNKLFKK